MSGADVLAVMGDALGDVMAAQMEGFEVETKASELSASIAAVAELIEATEQATEERLHDGASSRAACDRLVAALARVTGGES
jgi:hypothetical protein